MQNAIEVPKELAEKIIDNLPEELMDELRNLKHRSSLPIIEKFIELFDPTDSIQVFVSHAIQEFLVNISMKLKEFESKSNCISGEEVMNMIIDSLRSEADAWEINVNRAKEEIEKE